MRGITNIYTWSATIFTTLLASLSAKFTCMGWLYVLPTQVLASGSSKSVESGIHHQQQHSGHSNTADVLWLTSACTNNSEVKWSSRSGTNASADGAEKSLLSNSITSPGRTLRYAPTTTATASAEVFSYPCRRYQRRHVRRPWRTAAAVLRARKPRGAAPRPPWVPRRAPRGRPRSHPRRGTRPGT
jgi:hypothetical protein